MVKMKDFLLVLKWFLLPIVVFFIVVFGFCACIIGASASTVAPPEKDIPAGNEFEPEETTITEGNFPNTLSAVSNLIVEE